MSDDNLIFYLDGYEYYGEYGGFGGIYYRSMELGPFIIECRELGFNIIGIRFDESNNCELICSNNPNEVNQ